MEICVLLQIYVVMKGHVSVMATPLIAFVRQGSPETIVKMVTTQWFIDNSKYCFVII